MAGTEEGARSGQAGVVAKVVEELHRMLTSMELAPGQSLRQEALATRLGVSRAPVREALRVLESEGVLHYERNVGYTVKRLTAAEFEQTYLMRRVLEREVLRALPPLSEDLLDRLDLVNRRIEQAATGGDMVEVHRLNDDFHFLMFQASGLDLVVDELRRIWKLSNAYRSAYLLYDQASRQRIVHEHRAMVGALRHGHLEELVALMDQHRVGTGTQVGALLAVAAPPATPPHRAG
jgi:DNA-binding GntR family transcriptional regulator